ncbi:hypothetical protein BU607_11020 [Staphylococcus auricularis]|uniref:Uncharacterized protein n=1 Tax=Staphylococcus auricularis TaxID=29379 RepID=A0ABX5IBM0_9STAP|nr:hypothetical protein BU607_11020 [Staphylococcus auricularis]
MNIEIGILTGSLYIAPENKLHEIFGVKTNEVALIIFLVGGAYFCNFVSSTSSSFLFSLLLFIG